MRFSKRIVMMRYKILLMIMMSLLCFGQVCALDWDSTVLELKRYALSYCVANLERNEYQQEPRLCKKDCFVQNKKLLRKLDKRIFDEIRADIDKTINEPYMVTNVCFNRYYDGNGIYYGRYDIESVLKKYCNTCEKPKKDDKSKE